LRLRRHSLLLIRILWLRLLLLGLRQWLRLKRLLSGLHLVLRMLHLLGLHRGLQHLLGRHCWLLLLLWYLHSRLLLLRVAGVCNLLRRHLGWQGIYLLTGMLLWPIRWLTERLRRRRRAGRIVGLVGQRECAAERSGRLLVVHRVRRYAIILPGSGIRSRLQLCLESGSGTGIVHATVTS